MYNENKYTVLRPEMVMSSNDRIRRNEKVKRQAKRDEERRVHLLKREAEKNREEMIDRRINEILINSKNDELNREILIDFRKFLTTPYKYVSSKGYISYVTDTDSTCTSLMALRAVDGTLTDKRKNEELSELNAKRRKLNGHGKKRNGMPVTTRAMDGLGVQQVLNEDNDARAIEERAKRKKKIKSQLKEGAEVLTGLDKLVLRVTAISIANDKPIGTPELWTVAANKYTATERKIMLKLCVPDSRVLGKSEEVHVQVLTEKRISYLMIMSSKETLERNLGFSSKRIGRIRRE